MSKLNKVITAFQQDFTSVEKAQARSNIGAAAGIVGSIYKSDTVTLDSTQAQNGSYTLSMPVPDNLNVDGELIMRLSISKWGDSQQTPSQDRIPVKMTLTLYVGSASNVEQFGGEFERYANNVAHYLGVTVSRSWEAGATTLEVQFNWASGVIPQNTKLEFAASGFIIG